MILHKANYVQSNENEPFYCLCEDALSSNFSESEYSEPCRCTNSFKKVKRNYQAKKEKSQIISTIKNIKQPYKEINVGINNNQLALRIQRYPVIDQEKYDPPCECIEEDLDDPLQKSSSSRMNIIAPKTEKLLFKVASLTDDSKSNHTLQLTSKGANPSRDAQLDEPENAYILRIRRRAETWDRKKENIDLEFRIPQLSLNTSV